MYALVDCNNFYASCERVFRPELIGKPVVVLSNNDGCVIARSNEAKTLGIPMGAPAHQYEQVFAEKNVAVFSANFALYGDMSHRVMRLLEECCPHIEIYSIDEAFLQFSGYEHMDLAALVTKMKRNVTRSTGIPISVGLAPTKALAKVANRIAKKFPAETGGCYLMGTDEKREKALRWLKVEDVWGIGYRHARRLEAIGVSTAWDFAQLPDEWVRKNMSVVGLRLKNELSGKQTLQLEEPQIKQNIATTRSFETNYTRWEDLHERVSTFAVSCAEKLRKQRSCCNAIMVFVHTNPHRDDLPQYSRNIVMSLPYATQSAMELSHFATQALKRIFKTGYAYKKAGVMVMDIVPENEHQLSLFQGADSRQVALMASVDKLNAWYGQQKIKLASQDLARTWKMRQERLSPRYTTRLQDVITLHCKN